MRHILLGNIGFIGSIINDDRTVFVCIINPLLKLRLCDRRSCGVIGEAEINDVRYFLGKLGCKIIVCGTWHVDHIAPCLRCLIISTCSACHHIGIHIYGINRVTDSDLIVNTENFLNIAGITLGTVRHKDFISGNIAASLLIVVLRNGIS